ncbi:MAG: hypothetical protein V1663_03470 [archaeon]
MSLKNIVNGIKHKAKIAAFTGLAALVLAGTPKKSDAQMLYGYVTDVITGQGIPDMKVINDGVDSTVTDIDGYYNLFVTYAPPVGPPIIHPQLIRGRLIDVFNIRGSKVGTLNEGQGLEDFIRDRGLAFSNIYILRTPVHDYFSKGFANQLVVMLNNSVVGTGKESYTIRTVNADQNNFVVNSSSTNQNALRNNRSNYNGLRGNRSLDETIPLLIFRDESDTTDGKYWDIERQNFEISGDSAHNEEMVPTWMTHISNPFDSTFVDYNYWATILDFDPVDPTNYDFNSWKYWDYDSIGVYVPQEPPGSTHDYQQLVINSLMGKTSQGDPYDGWNTGVADLNRANNYPVFFIAPDCTYVINNGGAFVQYFPTASFNAHVTTLRGPPSPLKRIEFNLGYFNSKSDSIFLEISAHEFGHVQGLAEAYDNVYSDRIMYGNVGNPLFYTGDGTIDDYSKSVATIIRNRTDNNYGIIKKK